MQLVMDNYHSNIVLETPRDAPIIAIMLSIASKRSITQFVSAYLLEIFLYGVNTVLFITAVCVLLSKGSRGLLRALLISALAIFIVSTTSISLSAYNLFYILIPGRKSLPRLIQAKHTLYYINNIIADAMLIFRCYAVWSRSLYAIALPCVLLLATTIYGAIFMPGPFQQVRHKWEYIFLWLTLSTNITVTALIVGRIWWMAREAQKLLGWNFVRKHYSGIAITIETGAIYTINILVYQILKQFEIHCFALDIGLSQIAVIAPLLIIVQVGLGRHIQDVETNLRLRNGLSTVILSTVHPSTSISS